MVFSSLDAIDRRSEGDSCSCDALAPRGESAEAWLLELGMHAHICTNTPEMKLAPGRRLRRMAP